MAKVVIYTKENCPYCTLAKNLLNERKISFTEIRIDLDPDKATEMIQKTNQRTVPQIFINDEPIGGYDQLANLAKTKKLDQLLS